MAELCGCLNAQAQENKGRIEGNLGFYLGKPGANDQTRDEKLGSGSGWIEALDKKTGLMHLHWGAEKERPPSC